MGFVLFRCLASNMTPRTRGIDVYTIRRLPMALQFGRLLADFIAFSHFLVTFFILFVSGLIYYYYFINVV